MIDRYRLEVLPKKRSAQTRKDQGQELARLKNVFGTMRPDSLTAQSCYQYMDGRRNKAGLPAPVAARHEISLLGHVFQKAIRWGVASISNPVRGLEFEERAGKRAKVVRAQYRLMRGLTVAKIFPSYRNIPHLLLDRAR